MSTWKGARFAPSEGSINESIKTFHFKNNLPGVHVTIVVSSDCPTKAKSRLYRVGFSRCATGDRYSKYVGMMYAMIRYCLSPQYFWTDEMERLPSLVARKSVMFSPIPRSHKKKIDAISRIT